MTSTEFAAAQQRLLARRQLRESEAQTRRAIQQSQNASSVLSRLPFPFGGLGRRGIDIWEVIKGREGTRPSFRVGQVDAELLDEELLELLRGQVGEALKYFGVRDLEPGFVEPLLMESKSHLRDEWSSEILLCLRAVLFKLSIWDHDASYGATLQGLRYTDARRSATILATPSPWQKGFYGLATVGGRYAWEKWEDWLVEKEGGYEEV